MAVSSCNKEVATRLFQMLAVTEQAASQVKADHASYAKMSLLTQQMHMVQQQAVGVVNKSASKADPADDIALSSGCTTLSTEFDEGAKRLLTLLDVNKKAVTTIAKDHGACAKLSLLAEQVGLLQQQAQEAVSDAELNRHLTEVASRITCKLVCGTTYYHYTQNGREVLSRIAPNEWASYEEYLGMFLYDWDYCFRRQLEETEMADGSRQPLLLLLPHVTATPPTSDADAAAAPMDVSGSVEEVVTMRSGLDAGGMNDGKGFLPVARPVCPVLSRW